MPFELSWTSVVIGAVIFVISLVVTSFVAGMFLVRIRADHFVATDRGMSRRLHSSKTRLLLAIGKNLLGVVLIAAGIVLSLPGVPGQGLLTMLVGLFLLDIPAKRRLELWIVRRRRILHTINKLRARFGAAPLRVDAIHEAKRHGAASRTIEGALRD